MTWESAERVQKNDEGQFRALIGGQWVSVQKAQKNEAGEFRVERFQRQQMEEPEFEKEAKIIAAGSTPGGVAAETGKGLLRGASDIGLGVGKAGAKLLFGPIGGEVLGRGIEALGAPSRKLVAASPMGPEEAVAGIAGEFGGAFGAPSVPGLALKGTALASKAVSPVLGPVVGATRNFVDRLLPGGAERAVGRVLLRLAGEKRAPVMAALAEPAEIVPGSLPTAAETAAKVGSAEFAGAQRLAEQRLPTAFQDISSAQEAARQAAITKFGETPKILEEAIKTRAKEAKKLYGISENQVLKIDNELNSLLKSDSMKKAMERVKSIETEFGKARPSPEGTLSVGKLHYLKMAMDDFVSDPDKFGIAGLETAAYQGTREQLIKWITERSPLYEKARAAFAAASKPINVMQVGQQLEKSLTAPLGAVERPGPFATAMREAPRTMEKATKSPRFRNLEEAVGKENSASAEAVLADLSRASQQEKLARAGARRAREIVGADVPGLPATGPLNQLYMIFKTVFNRFGGTLGDKELEILSEVMKTPKETLRVMNQAANREALAQSLMRQGLTRLSRIQQLKAGGAGVAAETLQE